MTMIEAFTGAKANLSRVPVVVPPGCTIKHGYLIHKDGQITHHVPGTNNMPSLEDLTSDEWNVVYDDEIPY